MAAFLAQALAQVRDIFPQIVAVKESDRDPAVTEVGNALPSLRGAKGAQYLPADAVSVLASGKTRPVRI